MGALEITFDPQGRVGSIEAWGAGMLALGLIGAFLMVPTVRRLAFAWGWVDPVDAARKVHRRPTPRVGGICLFVPFLVGVGLVTAFLTTDLKAEALLKEWGWMIGGCAAMFALGLADDVHPLGAKVKLLGQFLICGIVVAFGFGIDALTNPFTQETVRLGWIGYPVAVFWLLATTNLINLIDGIDGLAAGVSVFVFTVLALTAVFTAGVGMLMVCLLMIGTLVGFLFFNFPPARIFMGDGGAYFLGFLIGQVGLACQEKSRIAAALVVPIIALGVPIIDTALAILRRGIRGLPIFRADREHVHHRMIDMGVSPQRVVLGLYAICILLSAAGFVVFFRQGKGLELALGLIFLLGVAAIWGLGYLRGMQFWKQMGEAVLVRGRTTRLIEACRRFAGRRGRDDDAATFWREFVELAGGAGFGYVAFRPARTGDPMFGPAGENRPELEKIEIPVLVGKRAIGSLELGQPADAFHLRLSPRYAHVLRDAFAERFRALREPGP